jgi:hypothetical protein
MKKLFKSKKAAFEVGTIVALVTGIGVSVMILIFIGVLAGSTYQLTETKMESIANNVVVGAPLGRVNSTITSIRDLGHSDIQTGTLVIANTTTTIGLANFTIDYDLGTVLLTTGTGNNTIMTANYTWGRTDVREYAKAGIVSGFSALKTTGDYIPIVVLAVIIAIVLSLVLGITSKQTGGDTAL